MVISSSPRADGFTAFALALVIICYIIYSAITISNLRSIETQQKAQIDEEGVPISIKNDDGHGFGVRNIREIARKYNGDIEIKQFSENDGLWFVLNIMFVG